MSASNRRKFIQRALLSGAALTVTTGEGAAFLARTLSPSLLYALGEAVLPGHELGPAGIQQVIQGFTDWLARYEPVGELNHGYFSGEIRYSPEHPGPRWASQLEALDLQSVKSFSKPFTALDPDQRRQLVEVQIGEEQDERLPRATGARHVAVGLLSYFYALPEATDLAYRAQISRNHCRPLAPAPELPLPLLDTEETPRG